MIPLGPPRIFGGSVEGTHFARLRNAGPFVANQFTIGVGSRKRTSTATKPRTAIPPWIIGNRTTRRTHVLLSPDGHSNRFVPALKVPSSRSPSRAPKCFSDSIRGPNRPEIPHKLSGFTPVVPIPPTFHFSRVVCARAEGFRKTPAWFLGLWDPGTQPLTSNAHGLLDRGNTILSSGQRAISSITIGLERFVLVIRLKLDRITSYHHLSFAISKGATHGILSNPRPRPYSLIRVGSVYCFNSGPTAGRGVDD